MHADLWDTETGNYFGRYEREEEALALVRSLVDHYGPEYAERLSFGAENEAGNWTEPLEGVWLLARAGERPRALGET